MSALPTLTTPAKLPTILVTGINGQVGFELQRSLQAMGNVVGLDRQTLDLADVAAIRAIVDRVQPSLIVNPAAYTAVDKAESEQAGARAINAIAPGVLASEAARLGVPLIHYSTDYVFNGRKDGPYVEDDATDPQNIYGATKLAGEQAIAASGCAHLIFRTSWVYGQRGGNFVKTMLRLGAEREELRVVGDQFGAPTWSRLIADMTAAIVAQSMAPRRAADRDAWWHDKSGIYHLCGGGDTTWAGFAERIFALKGIDCRVSPISTQDYPTPAKRPLNSRMSNDKLRAAFALAAPDWAHSLEMCLAGTA